MFLDFPGFSMFFSRLFIIFHSFSPVCRGFSPWFRGENANHQLLLAVDTWVVAELYHGIPNWKENFVTNISFPAPKARIIGEFLWRVRSGAVSAIVFSVETHHFLRIWGMKIHKFQLWHAMAMFAARAPSV